MMQADKPTTIGFPIVAADAELNVEVAPVIEWERFFAHFMMGEYAWLQGEHVALIGGTGSGKTSLAYHILPLRKYVALFATKVADPSIQRFAASNQYKRYKKWPGAAENPARSPRRLLWPPIGSFSDLPNQAAQFHAAMDDIYSAGSWCVYIDELYYAVNTLNLGRQIKMYLLQARSNGISLVQSTQRPAWVPLETYSNSRHLFFFATRDEVDLKRISGISSQDTRLVREIVSELDPYEFLYVNQRTGKMIRCTAPDPDKKG